jgi:hypothetical protein
VQSSALANFARLRTVNFFTWQPSELGQISSRSDIFTVTDENVCDISQKGIEIARQKVILATRPEWQGDLA